MQTVIAGPVDAELIVYFEDLQLENGDSAVARISFARLRELIPDNFDIATAINPDEAQQVRMQSEFSLLPGQVSAGMTATSYLVRCLLLEAITISSSTLSNSLQVSIKSVGLPIGAGLGSSAAFSVATTATCFLLLAKLDFNHPLFNNRDCKPPSINAIPTSLLHVINGWAYSGEVLMHGKPSGLDNSTSCFGGMVTYRKDPSTAAISFTNVDHAPRLQVLLVNTKVPRSTKQLVAMVGSLHNQFPAITQPVFNAISAITDTFLSSISSSGAGYNYEQTARLFAINHGLLGSLGVGHTQLTRVVEACQRSPYHLSCKLTGAGGGGCAICLLPEAKEGEDGGEGGYKGLVQQLEEMGFEVKVTALGGEGVTWII